MEWIDLAQERYKWLAVVNAVMNLRVPYSAGNFLTSWGPVSFSGRPLLPVIKYNEDDKLVRIWHFSGEGVMGGGGLKEIDRLEDKGVDGKIKLNWMIRKQVRQAGTGLMWLRKGASVGLLWIRSWTFGLHKMLGIFWVAEELLASQRGRSVIQLVLFVCLLDSSVLVYDTVLLGE